MWRRWRKGRAGALDTNRTCDLSLRRGPLYPLSYEGGERILPDRPVPDEKAAGHSDYNGGYLLATATMDATRFRASAHTDSPNAGATG